MDDKVVSLMHGHPPVTGERASQKFDLQLSHDLAQNVPTMVPASGLDLRLPIRSLECHLTTFKLG